MLEYKAYHKKSLGKRPLRPHAARKSRAEKGKARGPAGLKGILPAAAGVVAVVLLAAAGAMAYSFLGRCGAFSVREIDMNPCEHISREEIGGLLAGGARGNIWSLSAEEIGRRLRGHDWVRKVSVRKAFPDRLIVRVEERRPMAMINLDGLCYVDEDGSVFKRVTAYDAKDFPVITGFSRADLAAKDAIALQNLRRTIELIRLAEAGVLSRDLSEVHFDPADGYTLVTRENGLQLKIGTMDSREAMKRVEEAMPKLSRLGQLRGAIDLKHEGRIFVRTGE